MDQIIQHRNLYDDWAERPLAYQMANVGSEVSRAIKNREKPARFQGAYDRALELFDFTINALAQKKRFGALREVCRAREEFCDYFDENTFATSAEDLQKYYDDFALLLARRVL